MNSQNLIESIWMPQEHLDLRELWARMDDVNSFAHVVYNHETLELIYYYASNEEIHLSSFNHSFIDGWMLLLNSTEVERRMYKTVYSLPESRAPRNMVLPKIVSEVLAPTKGYLLYQDQIIELLKKTRNVNPSLIPIYIRNWNLKNSNTRLLAATVWLNGPNGINLEDLIEDRIYDSENKFLYV